MIFVEHNHGGGSHETSDVSLQAGNDIRAYYVM